MCFLSSFIFLAYSFYTHSHYNHCNHTGFLLFHWLQFLWSFLTVTLYFFLILVFYYAPTTPPYPSPPLTSFLIHCSVSVQGPHQRFLLRELLRDYNPMERPVANDSQALTVQFSFTLMQVMDVVRMAPNCSVTPT